jgi:murein DD-endopeptidase MepM/ murein hydrolase activator NlpD
MPSAGRGKDRPRFKPLVIAGPIAAVLLFTTLTGHVDLIGAMSPESAKIERVILERAILQATAQSQAAGAGPAPQTALVVTATPPTAPSEGVAAEGCEPSGDPRFCLYTIQEGDSLAAIATRFGLDGGDVPGWELLYESNKEDLAGLEEVLIPGWVLRVPNSEAVLHLVLPGDSVSAVAADYGVTTASIVVANGLADPDNVQIGDILLVPSPSQVPVVPPPEPLVVEEPEETPATEGETETDGERSDGERSDDERSDDTAGPEDESGDAAEEQPDEPSEPGTEDAPESGATEDETEDGEAGQETGGAPDEGDGEPEDENGNPDDAEPEEDGSEDDAEPEEEAQPEPDALAMSWPVVGPLRITNYMSARHPLGMDFGLFYAPTSSIMAAASGTVSFAGGDPCCSYGYYVIVDHGNGLQSLYAHLSSIAVSKGDAVGRGDSLGIAGNTGNSRGVHLHFEVYSDGKRVDPMLFLPRD